MPKSQFVDPEEVRRIGKVTFRDILLNVYNKSIRQEKANFTKSDLMRIFRDMSIIREFGTMLGLLATAGEYEGIKYRHNGILHLSTGQEAYAVGQAYLLDRDDQIFGSHRSHGEVIAKGLSAIDKSSGDELSDIMASFGNGSIMRIVEGRQKKTGDVPEQAIDFFLYGVLAEILGFATGFNRGMAGPSHVFFPPFGIYPNNSIVGGSAGIAAGAALFKKINRKRGIVISNTGDGSIGCGPVWEAFCIASMDQYRLLWDMAYRGGLPIIFNFVNNHYSIGSQSCGETMGCGILARAGAGVNPEQMHAERIDGLNPLAVIDAMRRKKKVLEDKKGPVLLDTLTYRFAGHTLSDASSYRTKEEIDAWMEHDSLVSYRDALIKNNIALSGEFDAIIADNRDLMKKILTLAVNETEDPRSVCNAVDAASMLYSDQRIERMEEGDCETIIPKKNNPRLLQIMAKGRIYRYRDAIFEALLDKFHTDPTLLAYGQENRDWGGIFGVYRGLEISLPYHRLFNVPVSAAATVASAAGYAMCGGRVVIELMYCDLLGRAADEVFNQLPVWQAMSGGLLKMPVVLRVPVGNSTDPQLSRDWTSVAAHMPGLKVVCPATPYDAKGLLNSALMGTDPVIFIENEKLYDQEELFHTGGVPEGYYEVPIGEPDIKRKGVNLTVITYGAALYTAVEAADILERSFGITTELIDLRSLVPLDHSKILDSVRKTGRVILVGECIERGSILNDISQVIMETLFRYLKAPPVVIGSDNHFTPSNVQGYATPSASSILDAFHCMIAPLNDYQPEKTVSAEDKSNRRKKGV